MGTDLAAILRDSLSGVSSDISWERLGKQILSLFHVDPLFGVSLDISWETLGKQILSLFHVDPLSGVPLDISWERIGKRILPLFHVDPLSRVFFLHILGKVWQADFVAISRRSAF